MDLQLTTATGKVSKKSVEVSEANFGREFSQPLVHQVVTAYLAGGRSGTRATKSRADVRGGGAKPWRQKGTGRARAGTIRSPIWRSGGHTFAHAPQDHSQKVNKKMYRNAMRAILSELVRQERLVIVEDIKIDAPKTKEVVKKLAALGLTDVLIVSDSPDDNLLLAVRNLMKVSICPSASIDPVSLLRHESVLINVSTLKNIEGMLG